MRDNTQKDLEQKQAETVKTSDDLVRIMAEAPGLSDHVKKLIENHSSYQEYRGVTNILNVDPVPLNEQDKQKQFPVDELKRILDHLTSKFPEIEFRPGKGIMYQSGEFFDSPSSNFGNSWAVVSLPRHNLHLSIGTYNPNQVNLANKAGREPDMKDILGDKGRIVHKLQIVDTLRK